MSKKMLIDARHPEETRVAVLSNGKVEDFDFESLARKPLRGNIYLARVTRVEPSLQAAFVEYGGNRHGFLAFSEIHSDYYQVPVSDREVLRAAEALEAELAEKLAAFDQSTGDDVIDDDDDLPAEQEASSTDAENDDESDEDDSKPRRRRRRRGRRGEGKKAKDKKSDADSDTNESEEADSDDDNTPTLEAAAVTVAATDLPPDYAGEDSSEDIDWHAGDADLLEALPVETIDHEDHQTTDEISENHDDDESDDEQSKPLKAEAPIILTQEISEEQEEEPREEEEEEEERDEETVIAFRRPEEDEDDEDVYGDDDVEDGAYQNDISDDDDESDEDDDTDEDVTSEDDTDESGDDEDDDLAARSTDTDESDEEPKKRELTEEEKAQQAEAAEIAALRKRYEEARRERDRLLKNYRIQEVIKRRQIMLVQVVKEERGNKGAALTTYLSLAGRYGVLMPNNSRGGGVSRKITNSNDRKRLRSAMAELKVPKGQGLIIRTAGAKRTKAEIKRDYDYLSRTWDTIREQTLKSIAPSLIYEEASLIKRAIRDLYDKDTSEILVEGDDGYREAKDFMKMLMPSHAKNVQPYREPVPMFLKHDVERQLDEMYQPVVNLKSGGYLVIQQTEALISIDVNSGKATKERNVEATALKTNSEAAVEVARQCRLRDLAGLVVIDFIDMEENRNNRAVEKKLKDAMKADRARIQIGSISNFGLLEMSRQRRRSGIVDGTTRQCPVCDGAGAVRSVEMAALRILRSIEETAIRDRAGVVTATTSAEVALYILNQKRSWLNRVEETYQIQVEVFSDPDKSGDQYDIAKRGKAPEMETLRQGALVEVTVDEDDDETVAEETSSDESDTQDDADEDRPKRRRRRRRRKDSKSDQDDDQSTSENDDDDQDDSSDDDNDQQSKGEDDEDGAPRKRRRRGRRGGRRNRRKDGDSDDHVESKDTSDASDASDVGEEPSGNGDNDNKPSEDAPADGAKNDKPAAAKAKSDEKYEAAPVAEKPRETEPSAPETQEPAAAKEPEPAPAREKKTPPPTISDPSQPKRGGWWQRAIDKIK